MGDELGLEPAKSVVDTIDHAAHEAFDKLMAKFGDFHRLMRRHPDASKVEDDGTFSFIFRPHTVSALLLLLSGLSYFIFYEEEVDDLEYNIKRGLIGVFIVFIAFGVTQARDGPFYRPHPIVWRFIHTCGVLYNLILVFLLFQTPKDFRRLVQFIDPSLNESITEQSYGDQCAIYDEKRPDDPYHNIKGKMDGFVIAHALGWLCKTLMIRDFWMTNLLSVTFEFLEYSLEHQLPNFSECWWDHWIMDVLVCNLLGIVLGHVVLKFLENKEYNWIGLRNQVGTNNKMKRMFMQFTPYSWVTFSWQPKANIFRWVCVSMIIIMILLTELNCFYLKFVMWAPPDHPYVLGRLCYMACMGAVALREAYDYLAGVTTEIGQSAWIMISIVITEAMICIKFGWETIMLPFPTHVKLFWMIAVSGYIVWSFWPLWGVKIDSQKPVTTPREEKRKNE